MATIGTANTRPKKPNKRPPTNTDIIVIIGCKPSFPFMIFGVRIMLSSCCTITKTEMTKSAFQGDIVNAITTAGTAPIYGPKYGIIL